MRPLSASPLSWLPAATLNPAIVAMREATAVTTLAVWTIAFKIAEGKWFSIVRALGALRAFFVRRNVRYTVPLILNR